MVFQAEIALCGTVACSGLRIHTSGKLKDTRRVSSAKGKHPESAAHVSLSVVAVRLLCHTLRGFDVEDGEVAAWPGTMDIYEQS